MPVWLVCSSSSPTLSAPVYAAEVRGLVLSRWDAHMTPLRLSCIRFEQHGAIHVFLLLIRFACVLRAPVFACLPGAQVWAWCPSVVFSAFHRLSSVYVPRMYFVFVLIVLVYAILPNFTFGFEKINYFLALRFFLSRRGPHPTIGLLAYVTREREAPACFFSVIYLHHEQVIFLVFSH